MTAKEKQAELVKSYLKPLLKKNGYQTTGQTWWRNQRDFFIIINLQNFSWNDKDNVDFCFNIGIGLTKTLKDSTKKKITQHDLSVYIRENFYLPSNRQNHRFKNTTGYSIKSENEFDDFKGEISFDFEKFILPKLDSLVTLADCLDLYGGLTFWGDRLRLLISENEATDHHEIINLPS